jgi:hypothetical protein
MIAASGLAAGICLLLILRYLPGEILWWNKIHQGNRLVLQIDEYRRRQGRLPASLGAMGPQVADFDRYYYEKCNEQQYFVWFGTTLGESMSYDSTTKKWDSVNTPCLRDPAHP